MPTSVLIHLRAEKWGGPFSASYFRECPQQSVSQEMTGHFFALLISPISLRAKFELAWLFNVLDFTSERLLHLHSMPEREIQTSKSLYQSYLQNNHAALDPLSFWFGYSVILWLGRNTAESQDSIRSRQGNLSINVASFCPFRANMEAEISTNMSKFRGIFGQLKPEYN